MERGNGPYGFPSPFPRPPIPFLQNFVIWSMGCCGCVWVLSLAGLSMGNKSVFGIGRRGGKRPDRILPAQAEDFISEGKTR